MQSNTEINHSHILGLLLLTVGLLTPITHAEIINCNPRTLSSSMKKICSTRFDTLRTKLDDKSLAAYLISDAPIRLLQDSQLLWVKQIKQCKKMNCVQQQLEQRLDDLDLYTSLNQSLTQHYLKFEHGQIAAQPVHFKIHQLTKERIKIEGIAYRNPNNRKENQTISFLAYTTPDNKSRITDNEHDCQYEFEFQKTLLNVKTQQKGCERFVGIYRLYD